MSASEKLKALGMSGTEDDAELITIGKLGLLTLRDTLPQIVAVVEAAEVSMDYESGYRRENAEIVLYSALTALDEALS